MSFALVISTSNSISLFVNLPSLKAIFFQSECFILVQKVLFCFARDSFHHHTLPCPPIQNMKMSCLHFVLGRGRESWMTKGLFYSCVNLTAPSTCSYASTWIRGIHPSLPNMLHVQYRSKVSYHPLARRESRLAIRDSRLAMRDSRLSIQDSCLARKSFKKL